MNTPICDFVRRYRENGTLRMHMPGHKGLPLLLGMEPLDITEIDGADSLYEANGIIRESEQNAAELFGSAATFYSTEGSSHAIRAMLYLTRLHAEETGQPPLILAARNAHKTFVTAAGLLGLDVEWLLPSRQSSYHASLLTPSEVEAGLQHFHPTALYLTSPDYLGTTQDVRAISEVCRRYGTLLLVDNAHGAYLRFLSPSRHPLDLGADLCCDSAHKTLPALTGAAYLHLSHRAPVYLREAAKDALSLFGSTSPSYLTLQSLDALNAYLSDGYAPRLAAFSEAVTAWKQDLLDRAIPLVGDEPLKLTVSAKALGYTGAELADLLAVRGIVCEFADPDFTVLMLSPELGVESLERLRDALLAIPRRTPLTDLAPRAHLPVRVCGIRDAILRPKETVALADAVGRVLGALNVSCPPAIPIAVCGEIIDEETAEQMRYYGIEHCTVLR